MQKNSKMTILIFQVKFIHTLNSRITFYLDYIGKFGNKKPNFGFMPMLFSGKWVSNNLNLVRSSSSISSKNISDNKYANKTDQKHQNSFVNSSYGIVETRKKHKEMNKKCEQKANKNWRMIYEAITNKYACQLPTREAVQKFPCYKTIHQNILNSFTHGKKLIRNSYIKFKDTNNRAIDKKQFERRSLLH